MGSLIGSPLTIVKKYLPAASQKPLLVRWSRNGASNETATSEVQAAVLRCKQNRSIATTKRICNVDSRKQTDKQRYKQTSEKRKSATKRRYASNPGPKKLAVSNRYASNPGPKKLADKARYASNPDPKKRAVMKGYSKHRFAVLQKRRSQYYTTITARRKARLLLHALQRSRENKL